MRLGTSALIAAWLVVTGVGMGPARAASDARLPPGAPTAVVTRYLRDLRDARFGDAYGLLNRAERSYYREEANFESVYAADHYRVTTFTLLRARGDDRRGRVFFARETARFRDHAHDVDLLVTATVPVGVVRDAGVWRIKDPGHPWAAFASQATADANGLRVTIKKMSFFPRRIEAVVTFVNLGREFVTVLPYGRSFLRDSAGRPYRPIETRDWKLTDKTLFEGLRLAPNAEYTGILAFACQPLANDHATFALTVAPLLVDGADAPFAIDVTGVRADGTVGVAR
jgi:hypothetical protein